MCSMYAGSKIIIDKSASNEEIYYFYLINYINFSADSQRGIYSPVKYY